MINRINYNYKPCFKASITDKEIDEFKNAKQYFSDCYIMTTLETLSHSENGRKILKEQIQHDDKNLDQINCYFYNPQGKKEKYTIPTDIVLNGYHDVYKHQENDIIRSVDISVNEYEKKHDSKPTICKLRSSFKYKFEYNLPSNFMKMVTGIKPRIIAETDLNINLNKHREEVLELFKKMEEEGDYSFVISTGANALDGHRWHVYILENVDLQNNTITVKEKRGNKPQTLSIDDALNKFKFIAGYLNSDLNKTTS